MPTALAVEVHASLKAASDPVIARLDAPDTRVPWPGQPRNIWPIADLSGQLKSGEAFVVEIDNHADPGRSFVKYWPLLHAVSAGEFQYPPIRFMEISSPDSTFGQGFELLARFIGERFAEQYAERFRFAYTTMSGKSAQALASEVLDFLRLP